MALYNLARMTTATTGTGTITLASAVSGFLSFASAGVSNGDTVTYAIRDGANSEIGRGVYTSSGTTLTRASILNSTNSGSAINLSGSAEVFITPAATDLVTYDGQAAVIGNGPSAIANQMRLIVSHNTGTIPAGDDRTIVHFAGISGTSGRVLLDGYGAHTVLSFRRSEGTAQSPTAVASGSEIGAISAWGYGATGYNSGASSGRCNIKFIASQTWTDTAQGAELSFETTPTGSATPAEIMRVTQGGAVTIGATQAYDAQGGISTDRFQVHGLGAEASIATFRWVNSAAQPNIHFCKSRGASVGTRGAVSSGDGVGSFTWTGDDGTNFVPAASMRAAIDGTPGTNDMPGRLLFLTTSDGASSVTERLRIGSDGHTIPGADNTYSLGKSGTRWSEVWAANGTIQTSDIRDKDIQSRILGTTAAATVDAIEPIMFRWKVGGHDVVVSDTETEIDQEGIEHKKVLLVPKAGSRLHAGFVAQEVKAAMDAANVEFGAWGLEDKNDPNSRQWIRPDQLIPVLWSALRQTRAELAALKAQVEAT